MEDYQKLIEQIDTLIAEKKITVSALSRATGVSRATIDRYRKGKRKPGDPKTVAALQTAVDQILDGQEETQAPAEKPALAKETKTAVGEEIMKMIRKEAAKAAESECSSVLREFKDLKLAYGIMHESYSRLMKQYAELNERCSRIKDEIIATARGRSLWERLTGTGWR